jgi:UPF0716 family protein affecting phage T7 exclusion
MARIGEVLAVLGLVLSLVGLALLVAVGVATAQNVLDAVHDGAAETPYTQYLASGWPTAVGLLVGGFVVNRFARILSGRRRRSTSAARTPGRSRTSAATWSFSTASTGRRRCTSSSSASRPKRMGDSLRRVTKALGDAGALTNAGVGLAHALGSALSLVEAAGLTATRRRPAATV